MSASVDEDISGYDKKPSWDVAVRYQDLKRLLSIPSAEKEKLRRRAIIGVLEKAKKILGSVLKPEKNSIVDLQEFQLNRERGELDIGATLEEALSRGISPFGKVLIDTQSLRFDARIEKESDVILLMDASLSMNGEKVALLAVAAAVVALCIDSKRLALIAFSSDAKTIKKFGEEMPVDQIIAKVLEIPTGGLTNLELGLKHSLKNISESNRDKANVVLISDGKYTEGRDPTYLAVRFKRLHALKLGRDIAGRALLFDLIAKGEGRFFEARRPHDLPRIMYGAMKAMLR